MNLEEEIRSVRLGKSYTTAGGAQFRPVTWPDGYRIDVKTRGIRSRRTAPYMYLSDAWGPNPHGLGHTAREIKEKAIKLRSERRDDHG